MTISKLAQRFKEAYPELLAFHDPIELLSFTRAAAPVLSDIEFNWVFCNGSEPKYCGYLGEYIALPFANAIIWEDEQEIEFWKEKRDDYSMDDWEGYKPRTDPRPDLHRWAKKLMNSVEYARFQQKLKEVERTRQKREERELEDEWY